MEPVSISVFDTSDVFKILVSSDNHLGYNEGDEVTGLDSFNTMKEIFDIAEKEDVDMVLLGGDLFHNSEPNCDVRNKAEQIFAKRVLGSRPNSITYLGGGGNMCLGGEVNFVNPHMNVAIPVFCVSGNHDINFGGSALDHLTWMNFLNEFGRLPISNEIDPAIFQKGQTKVALYGLQYMRRLNKQVVFKNVDNTCFNILTLHQNRYPRGTAEYVDENLISERIDLVLWGHEHSSIIKSKSMEETTINRPFVIQPGSTVATSFHRSESFEKQVALVSIRGKDFSVKPIKLATVRRMEILDVSTTQIFSGKKRYLMNGDKLEIIEQHLREAISSLLEKPGSNGNDAIPLVRLRLFNDNGTKLKFSELNLRLRFHFEGKIANKNILFVKHSAHSATDDLRESDDETDCELFRFAGEESPGNDSDEAIETVMSVFKAKCKQIKFEVLSPFGYRGLTDGSPEN